MKVLYLVRGLPGSGKSTFAKQLNTDHHYEADQYFMKDGEYRYDVTKIRHAHTWCQNQVKAAMIFEESITVSNTFTREREVKEYYDLAQEFGYQVFSVIVENRHNGVGIHNVPDVTMVKMKNRFSVKL